MFDLIAFDADDTLWHNETLYAEAQGRFAALLETYADRETALRTLREVEMANLSLYGYGAKGFALSMIEAAIAVSSGRIGGAQSQQIVDLGKGILNAPVELLEHVPETLAALADRRRLMVITKGDPHHQERKLATSGLRPYFREVEVVDEKIPETYAAILAARQIDPARFLMVGNSLKSDILPVIALGGWAVYVPYAITWSHEVAPPPDDHAGRYHEIAQLGLLPEWLASAEIALPD